MEDLQWTIRSERKRACELFAGKSRQCQDLTRIRAPLQGLIPLQIAAAATSEFRCQLQRVNPTNLSLNLSISASQPNYAFKTRTPEPKSNKKYSYTHVHRSINKMAQSTAHRRLLQEYRALTNNPPEGITAGPVSEDDLLHWEALIQGPEGTPFEGGIFPAELRFPKDYPLAPPTMKFLGEIWHPNGTPLPFPTSPKKRPPR